MPIKITTKPGYPARTCKRPKVGETVATRFGAAEVTKVAQQHMRDAARESALEALERLAEKSTPAPPPIAHWPQDALFHGYRLYLRWLNN